MGAEFCAEQLDTWTDISRKCFAYTPKTGMMEAATSSQTLASFYKTLHHTLENHILNLFMSLQAKCVVVSTILTCSFQAIA